MRGQLFTETCTGWGQQTKARRHARQATVGLLTTSGLGQPDKGRTTILPGFLVFAHSPALRSSRHWRVC